MPSYGEKQKQAGVKLSTPKRCMPVPAGVGHNMQQPVQAGQRMLSPIAPMATKGDLDKDGKMSSYEQARQTAIEKNMKK